ncbi:MAG: TIGR02757 family protein [Bdellovibrio sp.]|nr:TIGR02757 family protein [Bdellovibrio sp.]
MTDTSPFLGQFLNKLFQEYNHAKYLDSDPLEFAHRYSDPWDQEAVALTASLLAYGNVKTIRQSVQAVLDRISSLASSPKIFIKNQSDPKFAAKTNRTFANWVHRFNTGADMTQLFLLLNESWKKYGSLGNHFLSYSEPEHEDIGIASEKLIENWRTSPTRRGFQFLLASPSDGSCCKRWCMFLRWMIRKDGIDLGLWATGSPLLTSPVRAMTPSQLIMPLDTHTARISQYLGLTRRRTFNWKTAQEVTQNLKTVDPTDPTRYDFALSRLGILDICRRSYREEICNRCQLLPVCKFAQDSLKRSSPKKLKKA